MHHVLRIAAVLFSLSTASALSQEPAWKAANPLAAFEAADNWTVAPPTALAADPNDASAASQQTLVISNGPDWRKSGPLVTHAQLSDSLLKMEYLSQDAGARATTRNLSASMPGLRGTRREMPSRR